MVAGLTPPAHQVQIIDETIDDIDFNATPDLVGITAMTATSPRAYNIADQFRARGIPVVIGGMHASALPREALEHADAVVVGEAENTWPQLLADFDKGSLKPLYQADTRPVLKNLPLPRRELINSKRYLLPHTVQTTRGCPFGCNFCTVTQFFGHSYRFRPVEEVVEEVQQIPGKLVIFVDDNIVAHRSYARELFRALSPLGKKWISQGSLTMAKDEELLQLAAESGCLGMFIGFESLSPENLKNAGKRHNHAESFLEDIERIHKNKISIEGAFVFGFDGDDEGVFERTVDFARQARLEAAQFGVLTPFPGTPLREELEQAQRITDNAWEKYTINNVVFRPSRMSPGILQQGIDWAWKEFYSVPSTFRRLGLAHSYAPFLWALNLNFRSRVNNFLKREAANHALLQTT